MFPGSPNAQEIISGTRTTSGLMVTVPAGRICTANVSISGSVAVLGTCNPLVTVNGTDAAPVAGSVIARVNLSGLALTTVNGTVQTEIIARAPDGNGITIDFTAGASGTSSATINGYLI